MLECVTTEADTGINCIKCEFIVRGDNWGGWYFMNGVLTGSQSAPIENWGDYPEAGYDLRGATSLTFRAKGARGGERVEFFAFGVGFGMGKLYPDSAPKKLWDMLP